MAGTRERQPDARGRLVTATIALLQERGVHGAGVAELLERSGTARGSLYQHFPGGKGDLVVAAVESAAAYLATEVLAPEGADPSPRAVLDRLLDWWTRVLRRTDFGRGCPIAAAASAGPDEEVCVAAAAAAFTDWRATLGAHLADPSLAGLVVSAVEGALLQARALRSTEPLEEVRRHLGPLVASATVA